MRNICSKLLLSNILFSNFLFQIPSTFIPLSKISSFKFPFSLFQISFFKVPFKNILLKNFLSKISFFKFSFKNFLSKSSIQKRFIKFLTILQNHVSKLNHYCRNESIFKNRKQSDLNQIFYKYLSLHLLLIFKITLATSVVCSSLIYSARVLFSYFSIILISIFVVPCFLLFKNLR